MNPDGTIRSWRRYRRVATVTTRNTRVATNHSMNTCFVTEKSMPKIGGRWMIGWSKPLLAT